MDVLFLSWPVIGYVVLLQFLSNMIRCWSIRSAIAEKRACETVMQCAAGIRGKDALLPGEVAR